MQFLLKKYVYYFFVSLVVQRINVFYSCSNRTNRESFFWHTQSMQEKLLGIGVQCCHVYFRFCCLAI